jgi:hypothetical protein
MRFGALNLQLEARSLLLSTPPASLAINAALLHTFWRSQDFAFGIFGGLEIVHQSPTTPIWHVGAELQAYLAAASFYLQAGYIRITDASIAGPGWHARLATRFFPTENVLLEAGVRYLSVANGEDFWTLYGVGEVQLAGTPLSLMATVRQVITIVNSTTVQFGLRWNFGGVLADQTAPMDTLPFTF